MEKAALQKLTVLCLICAFAVVALLGVTAFSDGKREWKDYQLQYKDELLKKMTRERNPAYYDRIAGMQPEIKQVTVDEWKTVDRCMSCHMGTEDPLFADAASPLKTHPYPELLKKHPVEKYGCTICHGGQGLATTYHGASHKTIANWPFPMVPKGLMQSRCGYCHKDFEAIGADKLVKGRQLYQEMHCSGCHQIDNQGGAVGPDLSNFADKDPSNFSYDKLDGNHSKQVWVMEHFKSPQKVSPGTPMRTYALNNEQIECLSSYVLSLSQRNLQRQYTPAVKAGFVAPKVDVTVPEADLSLEDGGEEE
ncbi:cytochrome c [Geotalea sp. SG265]|uniref:c-type cytochrome n=1 Tax=Geotalea sp. SG265 TaxID=2922867 RepID=UPI001FAF53CF|nr:cytochrome c [Geotalea sp. SG265]